MTSWVISDTHFGHYNIIKYCDRPFSNVYDMDDTMLANINEIVKEDDVLYHLGDFAFGREIGAKAIKEYRSRIDCKNVVLVLGNHDRLIAASTELRNLFTMVVPYFAGYIDGYPYTLNHRPQGDPRRDNSTNVFSRTTGCINLFGHVHSNSHQTDPNNMCVEVHKYRPESLGYLREQAKWK